MENQEPSYSNLILVPVKRPYIILKIENSLTFNGYHIFNLWYLASLSFWGILFSPLLERQNRKEFGLGWQKRPLINWGLHCHHLWVGNHILKDLNIDPMITGEMKKDLHRSGAYNRSIFKNWIRSQSSMILTLYNTIEQNLTILERHDCLKRLKLTLTQRIDSSLPVSPQPITYGLGD